MTGYSEILRTFTINLEVFEVLHNDEKIMRKKRIQFVEPKTQHIAVTVIHGRHHSAN